MTEVDKHGDPAVGEPRFTRRHWLREARAAYLDTTGPLRDHDGKFSQFRIVLLILVLFYITFDREWNWPGVVAFSALIVALPLNALFARVPVAEALAAAQAVLTSIASQAVAKAGGLLASKVTRTDFREETTVTPAAGAEAPPPSGAAVL